VGQYRKLGFSEIEHLVNDTLDSLPDLSPKHISRLHDLLESYLDDHPMVDPYSIPGLVINLAIGMHPSVFHKLSYKHHIWKYLREQIEGSDQSLEDYAEEQGVNFFSLRTAWNRFRTSKFAPARQRYAGESGSYHPWSSPFRYY
jgi:hypothetical protein